MIFVKLILLIVAFFVSFLWLTKLITDFGSAMCGAKLTNEEAERDGRLRIYLIIIMSILWSILIII